MAQKEFIFPIAPSVRLVRDCITYCARHMKRYNPINISGYHISEAGSSPLDEVAFALCVVGLSVAWGFAFYGAIRFSEDRVLANQLRHAAERYPDLNTNLRGYDDAGSLPEPLRKWAQAGPDAGLYEFVAEELHVAGSGIVRTRIDSSSHDIGVSQQGSASRSTRDAECQQQPSEKHPAVKGTDNIEMIHECRGAGNHGNKLEQQMGK